MTDNIFNQSFESLLQSVGVSSETPTQEPTPQPTPAPVQESPQVNDTTQSIFDQFQLPEEVKAEEPVENKTEEYKVDMDIFGAQDVAPSVAPTEVKQEEIESAQPVVEAKPEPKPEPKPKKKAPAKKKAKAETTIDLKSEGLIDAETVAAIEEEIDIIVKKALRKSIVKNLKAIADEM